MLIKRDRVTVGTAPRTIGFATMRVTVGTAPIGSDELFLSFVKRKRGEEGDRAAREGRGEKGSGGKGRRGGGARGGRRNWTGEKGKEREEGRRAGVRRISYLDDNHMYHNHNHNHNDNDKELIPAILILITMIVLMIRIIIIIIKIKLEITIES